MTFSQNNQDELLPTLNFAKINARAAELTAKAQKVLDERANLALIAAATTDPLVSQFILPYPLVRVPNYSYRGYVNIDEESLLWDNAFPITRDNPRHKTLFLALTATNSQQIYRNFWSKVHLPNNADMMVESHWSWTSTLHSIAGTPTFSFRAKILDPLSQEIISRLLTVTGVEYAFAVYTGTKTSFGLRQACGEYDCVNPFHMSPHRTIAREPLRPGRKPEGWVNPNKPRGQRPRPPMGPLDQRTQLGKARLREADRLIASGIPSDDAYRWAASLVFNGYGGLVPPSQ